MQTEPVRDYFVLFFFIFFLIKLNEIDFINHTRRQALELPQFVLFGTVQLQIIAKRLQKKKNGGRISMLPAAPSANTFCEHC